MHKSSGRNSVSAVVKDVFEIKPHYKTNQEPGVVAVLDRHLAYDLTDLCCKMALFHTPNGGAFEAKIKGARDHGRVHSLFFNTLTSADLSIGYNVEVCDEST